MGQTRVIYSDATTAEATAVLKAKGFRESADGSHFLSPDTLMKAYIIWGKARYYPELLTRFAFSPRIQIHLKSREDAPGLSDLARAVVSQLQELCGESQFYLFDVSAGCEITIE